jgi:hypothetical protein
VKTTDDNQIAEKNQDNSFIRLLQKLPELPVPTAEELAMKQAFWDSVAESFGNIAESDTSNSD